MTYEPEERQLELELRQLASSYDAPPPDRSVTARLAALGPEALSDSELLLAVLGTPGCESSPEASSELAETLERFGGLGGLPSADLPTLVRELGAYRGHHLTAVLELARRLTRSRLHDRPLLNNPGAVAEYVLLRYANLDQEVMGALYLDVRSRLITEREIFRGTLNRAAVEPRPILKQALLLSASSLLLVHNHPSGDPAPSNEDLSFTRRVAKAGKLLGVRLVDHLIVAAGGRWVSLKRRGAW